MNHDSLLYDTKRLAENSAVMDYEVQRLVVMLGSIEDEQVRDLVLTAAEKTFPDFLAKAEEFRQLAVAILRLNESIDRFLTETTHDQEPPVDGRGPAQTPQQIDPVFAEAMAQRKQTDGDT